MDISTIEAFMTSRFYDIFVPMLVALVMLAHKIYSDHRR